MLTEQFARLAVEHTALQRDWTNLRESLTAAREDAAGSIGIELALALMAEAESDRSWWRAR